MIPGERSARTVRAMHARSKPYDQQSCLRITERRYRPALIAGVTPFDGVHECRETLAAPTAGIETFGEHL